MSQCSDRVKHALSRPFVSSGLFLPPAPAAKDKGPAFGHVCPCKGTMVRPQHHGSEGSETGWPTPRLSPHRLESAHRKNGQYLCGYVTLYIGRPACHFATTWTGSRIPDTHGLCPPFSPPCPALPPASGPAARLGTGKCRRLHQKHTNWSQIMHQPPQLAPFTGMHCI